MRLLELSKQLKYLRIILILIHIGTGTRTAISEGDMRTEEDDFVGFVLDQIQIGFEPIVLLLRETRLISPRRLIGSRTYDIVHHDDMRFYRD